MTIKKRTFNGNYLQASINYADILDDGTGIYIWLNPDEASTLAILRLVRGAPFKSRDGTELHTTIMYCKAHMPENLQTPEDQVYKANIVRVDQWVDHKQRTVFVLAIESEGIRGLHENLVAQGLTHSFDAFCPHISIAKDLTMGAEQRLWLEETNERLAASPIAIAYSPQLRASPL